MIERMARAARAVVAEAIEEARALGSPTVEAEHLLLALSRDARGVAGGVLWDAGLDHESLLAALDAELSRSLELVGVAVAPADLPPPAPAPRRPRWGTSAAVALRRAVDVARGRGERRIVTGHLLMAVLAAREGTVPRALRGAGAHPDELSDAAGAALERRARPAAA